MVGEDGVEAAVAEESAAELADAGGGEDPRGGFCVDGFELLEFAVLGFGEDAGADGGGCVDGVVFGFGFLARLPGGAVVTEAAAVFGAFGGAVEEGVFAGGFIVGDDVGFAAGAFHFGERPEFVGSGGESGFDLRPFKILVTMKIFVEAGFEGGEELFGLLGGEGFFWRHGGNFSVGNWKRENGNLGKAKYTEGRGEKSKTAPFLKPKGCGTQKPFWGERRGYFANMAR